MPSYGQFGSPGDANRGQMPGQGELATWGPRVGGYLLDVVIILIPYLVLVILGAATSSGVFTVIGYIYEAVMWIWFSIQVGSSGASPGMRVVGLKCVKSGTGELVGGGIGFVRLLLNTVLGALFIIPGIVNVLWPLWDSQRQTLADKIAGTYVIRVPSQGFSLTPRRAATQ